MHARIEQLLSLRDGEPVDVAVQTHVAACAQCAKSLAALRLDARTAAGIAGQPESQRRLGGRAARALRAARLRTRRRTLTRALRWRRPSRCIGDCNGLASVRTGA